MQLLNALSKEFSNISFEPSDRFSWSPETKAIYYDNGSEYADWSLLHEIGHVICEHQNYQSDIGLLKMEVEAWQKARELAIKYKVTISGDHIEKCLDSYREWIYKRSSCPDCSQAGVEKLTGQYQCINCKKAWRVTTERFCRVYRKTVIT